MCASSCHWTLAQADSIDNYAARATGGCNAAIAGWRTPCHFSCPCRNPNSTRRTSTRAFRRSEEHTSELQSLMRISYAVFCLKKKKQNKNEKTTNKQNTDIIKMRKYKRL